MSTRNAEHDLHRAPMRERLSMPRRRGGLSGTLLLLAGIWGAAIPFVGPYFDWVIGPDTAFDMTSGRFWLSLVPGLAVIAGGLLLLMSANRATAALGAWLALAGGAWFAVGPTVSRLWNDGESLAGAPMGGPTQQSLETLTYFEGLGALIVALAAFALGRVTVRSVRDALAVRTDHDTATADDGDRESTGRFTRKSGEEREPVPAGHPGEDRPAAMRHSGPPPIGPGQRAPAPSDTPREGR